MEAGDMNTPGHGMSGGVGKFTDKSGFVCLCRRPVVRLGAMVLQRVGQAHAL